MATESLQHFIGTLKSKLANERDKNARLQAAMDTLLHERNEREFERDVLQTRVEGLDTDLTEIATTITEHFDSVDLNDLPVSLTKGIKVLVARSERREREWDFLCSLLKIFAEGLDGGRRKALLALPNRARAAIEGRVP